MREQGIVTKAISGNIVEVAFQRSEACAKCKLCHGVGEGLVGIETVDEIGAKLGDIVEIEIPSGEIVKGSIVVFLMPIFFLMVGYLIGANFSSTFGIILGLIFVGLSYFVIKWYDKNVEQRQALRARIVKIVTSR